MVGAANCKRVFTCDVLCIACELGNLRKVMGSLQLGLWLQYDAVLCFMSVFTQSPAKML